MYRKTYLTLREIWLDKAKVKLSLVYQERLLTDCSEDVIGVGDRIEQDVCSSELQWSSEAAKNKVKIGVNVYGNDTDADEAVPKEFPWLLMSLDEMRQRCAFARNTTKDKP